MTKNTKRAKEALEFLGLDFERIKDKSPLALSGGEKGKSPLQEHSFASLNT